MDSFWTVAVAEKVIRIILVLIGAYLTREASMRLIRSGLSGLDRGVSVKVKMERVKTLGSVFSNLASFVIGIIALLIILSELGVDIAPLLAGLGVLGLGVGLAAQTLIKDYISGFFILFENQFNVGDEIEIAGKRGAVKELSLRFTLLKDSKGSTYLISNSEISTVTKFKK
jgi:small conductance mechanosensitive channel